MKKIQGIAFLAVFLISLLAFTVNNYTLVHAQDEYGIEDFVRHDWQFATLSVDLQVIDTTGEIPPIVNYTDDLVNQLEGATLTFILGRVDESEGVVYIVPVVKITNDLTVSAEILEVALDIPSEDAAELAFTIPRGSGIIILAPTYGVLSMDKILYTIAETILHASSTTMYIWYMGAVPYPYKEAIAPLFPMVDPSMLSSYGDQWKTMELPEGITASYKESEGKAIFTMSGSNETEYTYEDYHQYQRVEITTFRSEYSLETGILLRFEADVESKFEYTYGDETQRIELSANIVFEHTNAKEIEIGLSPGDILGFKVTNFTLSQDLIDVLNETLGMPEENITEFVNLVRGIKTEYTYISPNPVLETGLDLFYNITAYVPDQEPVSGFTIMNVLSLGAPYVLPEWDLIYGSFQFWAHLELNVVPKFAAYAAYQEDPNIILEISGDYSVLEREDYVSTYITANAHLGYAITNETEGVNKTDLQLSITTWYTYDKDGFLTEFYISIEGSFKIDTDGDNSLEDEDAITGTIVFQINRVQTNPTTNEPQWDNPINPPNPTEAGWTDVTPYRAEIAPGGFPGIPIEPTYIAVGVVAIVIIIVAVAFMRRR